MSVFTSFEDRFPGLTAFSPVGSQAAESSVANAPGGHKPDRRVVARAEPLWIRRPIPLYSRP
jgi:hypothetical protein